MMDIALRYDWHLFSRIWDVPQDRALENWLLPTRILFLYTLGPFILGHVIFWIFHQFAGLIASLVAGNNEETLERIKFEYIYRVTRAKELTFPWTLGLLLLIIVGVIA